MGINIIILASGSGTNAEALIKHFAANESINIAAVLSNKKNAYALKRAENYNISSSSFARADFESSAFAELLANYKTDYIVLAGFLWKMPELIVNQFSDRIINIHPALLPNYGGKGMYGSHVHEAVIANGESLSGITIHLVNNEYDKGRILFQASCEITPDDTPDSLAQKVHRLEHQYFSQVVEDYIQEHSQSTY